MYKYRRFVNLKVFTCEGLKIQNVEKNWDRKTRSSENLNGWKSAVQTFPWKGQTDLMWWKSPKLCHLFGAFFLYLAKINPQCSDLKALSLSWDQSIGSPLDVQLNDNKQHTPSLSLKSQVLVEPEYNPTFQRHFSSYHDLGACTLGFWELKNSKSGILVAKMTISLVQECVDAPNSKVGSRSNSILSPFWSLHNGWRIMLDEPRLKFSYSYCVLCCILVSEYSYNISYLLQILRNHEKFSAMAKLTVHSPIIKITSLQWWEGAKALGQKIICDMVKSISPLDFTGGRNEWWNETQTRSHLHLWHPCQNTPPQNWLKNLNHNFHRKI